MKRAAFVAVSLSCLLPACGELQDEKPKVPWEEIWGNKETEAAIRNRMGAVDITRMASYLNYLSKDPLPCRKLNFTLPGHEKNTLYEADYFISGMLDSWGYRFEKEGVQVRAFRRDASITFSSNSSRLRMSWKNISSTAFSRRLNRSETLEMETRPESVM